jgi:hypothetical protein
LDQRIEAVQDVPLGRRDRKIILFGGPPCQGFSTSNQRTRNSDNPSNWLFREYMRLVRTLFRPSGSISIIRFTSSCGMIRSDSAVSERGSSSPVATFRQYPIRSANRKKLRIAASVRPLGDRRETRSGQLFGEEFQVERIGFREGFVRGGGQTAHVTPVDAAGRRTPLAAKPQLDCFFVRK